VTDAELLESCQHSIDQFGHVRLTPQQLAQITDQQANLVTAMHGATHLMLLPEHEVAFFEWLKTADPQVWNDLWSEADIPYLVSLAFLAGFCGANANGIFVICDLLSVPNYYFSSLTFVEKESDAYIQAVRDRFTEKRPLTTAQALALEASVAPIDVWHFAYRYGIDVDTAKRAAHLLADDRIVVHVPSAEHLAELFDVR
jgi:hypothetical protein